MTQQSTSRIGFVTTPPPSMSTVKQVSSSEPEKTLTTWYLHPNFIPLIHCTLVTVCGTLLLIWELYSHSDQRFDEWIMDVPSLQKTSQNSILQNWMGSWESYRSIFAFSMTYFIWDTVFMIVYFNSEGSKLARVALTIHHVLCIYGLLGPFLYGGADSRIILINFVLCEASNVVRTIASIFTDAKRHEKLRKMLQVLYIALYIGTRIPCLQLVYDHILFSETYNALLSSKITASGILVFTTLVTAQMIVKPELALE